MSLSKQLLILISALFLMIFSVNFALSVGNIKGYLEGESKSHAQDTATSLGLSLSPYMVDPDDQVIQSMASAIFDMGYYKEIRIVDAENRELVELTSEKRVEGVPDWFIDRLPMTSATAEAEISTGWNLAGVVYVTVNPGFAYLKLYEQAKSAFYYSLAAFLVSISLLVFVLRMTLAPLNKIDWLARRISEGHYETIHTLPWTREVRNVAASMNTMSQKIKTAIASLQTKLDRMGINLLRDDLTGLFKKTVFETDLKPLFAEHGDAHVALIRLDSLTELVKEHDSAAIDDLLNRFAKLLQQTADSASHPVKPYRFYGAEFALLIETADQDFIENLLKNLAVDIAQLGEQYRKPDLVHIGVARLNPVGSAESLLEAAHEAHEQAQLIGANSYFIRAGDNIARDITAWKSLVFDCVDRCDYSVWYIGQTAAFATGALMMEEAFIQVHDRHGELVSIGPFISIAEKFAKIVDLDRGIIEQVVQHIRNGHLAHSVAVNLSTRTVRNGEFRRWLEILLKQSPIAAKQLVFSLSAYAVAKDVEAYRDFIADVHSLGGRVMIKRFETQSLSAETVKRLRPDFVRLARDLGNGVSDSAQKHVFVQTVQDIAALMDIAVLAENVQSEADYQTLKAMGLAGASR